MLKWKSIRNTNDSEYILPTHVSDNKVNLGIRNIEDIITVK